MSRPLTIHSDGTGRGTIVLDEDGKALDKVREISINIDANGSVEAVITVAATNIVVQANLTEVLFACPACFATHEHVCDSTFPIIAPEVCGDEMACIRTKGHALKHFDGEQVWE